MSEKKEENIVYIDDYQVSDEEFAIFMKAFLGEYKGPRYNPE